MDDVLGLLVFDAFLFWANVVFKVITRLPFSEICCAYWFWCFVDCLFVCGFLGTFVLLPVDRCWLSLCVCGCCYHSFILYLEFASLCLLGWLGVPSFYVLRVLFGV